MTVSDLNHTLADLIRINSVNSFYEGGPGEAEMANYVEHYFQRLGLRTWRQTVFPGRDNVIACLPGKRADRRLILEAHMDTVSVQGMTIPPFEPTVENNRMYGRGSCDTKAGLAAMMQAMADLKTSGQQPACEVWLAAVVDEEFSFRGVVKLCEDVQATGAVIAEPTGLQAVIASKGVLRWRMVSRGVSAHSSKSHLGINAISHMARVVLALERDHAQLAALPHPLLGPASCNVGRISGGVQVNFVPDLCTIEIDRRLLPAEDLEDVLAHYQGILDQLRSTDPTFDVIMEEPMLVDIGLETPADAAIAQVASTVLNGMGLDGSLAGVPFGSDASKLARAGVPSIIFGPGDIDQAHAAVEYVDLGQVAQAAEFYRRLLTTFVG
ncbi:MAG: M20 family metallopeptidase [Pirellulaceae bacterium]|nr:M20 family metallopeptidase [Pirellulaceae bacterium]